MSKNQDKRKPASMKETAELQTDKSITLLREVEYDNGQIDFRQCTVTPALAFYNRCKNHFALSKPGDWNSASYTWTREYWVDDESNKYWLLDD